MVIASQVDLTTETWFLHNGICQNVSRTVENISCRLASCTHGGVIINSLCSVFKSKIVGS